MDDVRYRWELWMDGQMLTESGEDEFDTEDEAEEDAKDAIDTKIADWQIDGCYNGETVDDFEIKIREV